MWRSQQHFTPWLPTFLKVSEIAQKLLGSKCPSHASAMETLASYSHTLVTCTTKASTSTTEARSHTVGGVLADGVLSFSALLKVGQCC